MIISVPHSGTRSLRDHLQFNGYWHFGQNDADIRIFTGHADIPIRNPIDIARSWDARYLDEEGKGPQGMLIKFDMMFEFIDKHHDYRLWKIEDLPVNIGKGPDKFPGETPRITAMRDWLTGDRMAFYEPFYGIL